MEKKKKMMGYQEGGDISKGLLRRYNKHLSPESQMQNAVPALKNAATGSIQPGVAPVAGAPTPSIGVSSNAFGDHAGFVTTKHGATVVQANPGKGPMNTDKMHMQRTIKDDRKAGWNNFISGLGFQKKNYTST